MTQHKTKYIPLFPLNVCLFPGEDLPIKIFEPRYKQLINDTLLTEATFGIPYFLENKLQSVGTEVKIKQVIARNSLDEMVIMVEGVSNFEILEFDKSYKDKLYGGGKVIEMKPGGEIADMELIQRIIYYADTINEDFLKETEMEILNSDDIAQVLNLNSIDKFRYISMGSQEEKENFIRFNIDTLYKLSEQERLLNSDYSLN